MSRTPILISLSVVAVIAGCGSATPVAKRTPAVRGRPAHVRLVNLTQEAISANVGTIYPIANLGPGEMSGALPVAPNRSFKITATVKGKALELEQKTEPGRFATVVITDKGMTGFISGASLSRPDGPKVDYVNLTNKPLDFKSQGKTVNVGPMTSESIDAANGTASFSVGSAAPVSADNMGKAQIWAIYAYNDGGTLQVKAASVKGTGAVAGAGGTAL